MWKKYSLFFSQKLRRKIKAMTLKERRSHSAIARINTVDSLLWLLYGRDYDAQNTYAESYGEGCISGKFFERHTAEQGWLIDWLQITQRIEVHAWESIDPKTWNVQIACHCMDNGEKSINAIDCRVDLATGKLYSVAGTLNAKPGMMRS